MQAFDALPARAARQAAGLSLQQAARLIRVSPEYLARLERTGRFPYHLAQRLSRQYPCRLEVFLPPPGGRTPDSAGDGRRRTSRPHRGGRA